MKRISRLASFAGATLIGVSLFGVVYSCIPNQLDSVHFGSTMPDFAAPPRPVVIPSWGEVDNRKTAQADNYYTYEEEQQRETAIEHMKRRAREEEKQGHFAKAREIHGKLLERVPADQSFRLDRLEVLGLGPGVAKPLLQRYLDLTANANYHAPAEREPLLELYKNPNARSLRAHALYAYASWPAGDGLQASKDYERVAQEFPHSTRAEPALIMAARVLLQEDDAPAYDQANLARARGLLETLVGRFPKTRFKANAIGWMARIDYLKGRFALAEKGYFRQLAGSTTDRDRLRAYMSVVACRQKQGDRVGAFIARLAALAAAHEGDVYVEALNEVKSASEALSVTDADRITEQLIKRTDLLGPYLDFRLYHTDSSATENRSLLWLANRAFRKHPDATVGGQISARIAELQYRNGDWANAIVWAERSLSSGGSLQSRADLALYIKGALLRRKGSYSAGIFTLNELIRRFPSSYLVGGARENLALAYESLGRLDKALDQYVKLGYEADIAYLLDAKMPIEQVRRYARSKNSLFGKRHSDFFHSWEKAPQYTYGDVVAYSLGTRLLRDFKLDEARRVFQNFSRKTLEELAFVRKDWWSDDPANILRNPLNTIHALQYHNKQFKAAKSDEQKAGARYGQAAYIYNNRDLLFYNRALWEGSRETNLVFYYNTEIAKPEDTVALREHCYSHECLSRARQLFKEVAAKWPKTSWAPKALYSAACATERLSNMNEWWRQEDSRSKVGAEAVVLMNRLAKNYPDHPLAHNAKKYAKVWAKPHWN